MPVTLTDLQARLEGGCVVEDAEVLLDWLQRTPTPQVDLSSCEHMHAAVLQTLLALRPPITAMPSDAILCRLLRAARPALQEHAP